MSPIYLTNELNKTNKQFSYTKDFHVVYLNSVASISTGLKTTDYVASKAGCMSFVNLNRIY